MKTCLFCSIVARDSPAFEVYRDAVSIAFLDVKPLFRGHVLVVPRGHCETLSDLPPIEVEPFFAAVQRLAAVVEQALDAQGTFVAMNNRVSQSVPHLHVHVVPRRKGDGLRGFFWPRTSYASAEQATAMASLIAAALALNTLPT